MDGTWARVGDPRKRKLQGLRGRSWSLISPTKESRLRCVGDGEQLKTFQQGNNMVHHTFLLKHSDRCVDWLIGFQDRWLETTLQIRDDKAIPTAVAMGKDGRSIC